jgi:hypothetical protein
MGFKAPWHTHKKTGQPEVARSKRVDTTLRCQLSDFCSPHRPLGVGRELVPHRDT